MLLSEATGKIWFMVNILKCSFCKGVSCKSCFPRISTSPPDHARRMALEEELAKEPGLSQEARQIALEEHARRESDFTRLQRQRMASHDFEPLTIIGRGAFGEVGMW